MRTLALLAASALALLAGAAPAGAQTLPSGFQDVQVAAGLTKPNAFAIAPDGRIFVAEDDGYVKVVKTDGTVEQLLDISGHVNNYGDRGLLGIEVDTDFANNGFLYLLYTYEDNPFDVSGPKVSRLTRVVVRPDNTVQSPDSPETIILGSWSSAPCPPASDTLDCIPADRDSHAIGTVKSAPDGTLWVGSGDAAPHFSVRSDISFRTYDESSFAGKIIHIDRDGHGIAEHPFCPEETNLDAVCTKIYAKGFRNPFRFHLRGGGRGPLVGDVGSAAREEMDATKPGADYGWPCYEGSTRTPGYDGFPECAAEYAKEGTPDAAVGPTYEYPAGGWGAAIILGPEYRGSAYPEDYRGSLFVADYVEGWVRRIRLDENDQVVAEEDFATDLRGVDIQEGPDGAVYFADLGWFQPGAGTIHKVVYQPGNSAAKAKATASQDSGLLPLVVEFDGSGSSDDEGDELTYHWDFGDGSPPSTEVSPEHTFTEVGQYTVRLTVDDGTGRRSTATVDIAAGTTRPHVTIAAPTTGGTFRAGVPVALSGIAEDAEDGVLSDAALRWDVVLHHNTHLHGVGSFSGTTSAFTPTTDHDADSYYTVRLTATDSAGASTSTSVRLDPETASLTLDSFPAGAPLSYASRSVEAPYSTAAAIGFETVVGAAEEFEADGIAYRFQSWSDGGARTHAVTVPETAETLIATYAPAALVRVDAAAAKLRVTARPGDDNVITVGRDGDRFLISDAHPLEAGHRCTQRTPTEVSCEAPGLGGMRVVAGDGNDTVTVTANSPAEILGGSGDDQLHGGPGNDVVDPGAGTDVVGGGDGGDRVTYERRDDGVRVTLNDLADDGEPGEGDRVLTDVEDATGGAGNDVLVGDGGANTLRGEGGDDHLEPLGGRDDVAGGAGVDVASYHVRSAPVRITLDGVADDGAEGEEDNIRPDVEQALGGSGDDVLVGNGDDNRLTGGAGDDYVEPLRGTDFVIGGDGVDVVSYHVYEEPVRITLDGTANDGSAGEGDNVWVDVESMNGGAAGDILVGDQGANRLNGMGGNDFLEPLAGKDEVSGGDGAQDRVSYHMRNTPVSVSLDGQPNDGAEGEEDNVFSDVEDINGGNGDDVLEGDINANDLRGRGGDDRLNGGRGTDFVVGGDGNDIASYADRGLPVTASPDGAATDGYPGENDNVWVDVEGLEGGRGNDILVGNAGDNRLIGGPGDDHLEPLLGSDVVEGGDGGGDVASYHTRNTTVNASLDGAANDGAPGEGDNLKTDVERVLGGEGDDVLAGGPNADVLFGRGGNDVLEASDGADEVHGGPGADEASYAGRAAAVTVRLDGVANDGAAGEGDNVFTDVEHVRGGEADDVLVGNGNDNRISGGAGDDYLEPLGGSDVVTGDAGTGDRVSYHMATEAVKVSLDGVADDGRPGENDNVREDVENVNGGEGDDILVGSSGDNHLAGRGGNDHLEPLLGRDVIEGGAGTADVASYHTRSTPVDVSLDGFTNDGAPGEGDSVLTDVERVLGGEGDDILVGGPHDDVLFGRGGNDFLEASPGTDSFHGGPGTDNASYFQRTEPVTVRLDGFANDGAPGENDNVFTDVENIQGGEAADTLVGNSYDNRLSGRGGDDYLEPLGGTDQITGGNGAEDRVSYHMIDEPQRISLDGVANDGVDGENDNVYGDVENVNGGAGNDVLAGNALPNAMAGRGGDDVFEPGYGADTISGGAGADRVTYEDRTNRVVVRLDGVANDGEADENDQLYGDVEHVTGGSGDDLLVGDAAANLLDGGAGNDELHGGAGRDEVAGGAGDDTLELVDTEIDVASCGSDSDTVRADLIDLLGPDCEARE